MVNSTSDITGDSSALVVRTSSSPIRAGLLTAAVAASLIISGASYVDRSVSSVNNFYGTGSYLTYLDTTCANTGGLAKYTSCSIANPFTGTGVITRVEVDSNKAPTASSITCTNTQVGSTVATGANILIRYVATASGKTIFVAPSGTGSAVVGYVAPLVLPSANIRCWHSTIPGPGVKEQLRVWLTQQYIP